MSVQERVLKVIFQECHRELSVDQIDQSFEELGLDSLDRVCIMFGLEQEFDVTIPEAEAAQVKSVPQIIDRLSGWIESPAEPSLQAPPCVSID